ncbi:MAG: hypothetical protein HKN87_03845 [Saprospiraceae bacterium]|nr:hypothetical protein [Saprospiraceae bacterium]
MRFSDYLSVLILLLVIDPLWSQGIQISETHPQYWTYDGQLTLLLGGSNEDNLFQMPGVEQHLDTLVACSGNYVRCTMSSRDSGNSWPFFWDAKTGKYDLNKWDQIYWKRFADFLRWTAERDIVVQIEIWATFDFYRDNWDANPFNPKNNSTYSFQRTELLDTIPTHPIYADNPFFTSVPALRNNMKCLEYQQRFVDKILSHSLQYDHILYCMDNETSVSASWGKFWADYIHKRAIEANKLVHCTEMWDPWDLDHIAHRESFDHPEIYDFVEISQNNHHRGEQHWKNGKAQIDRLKKLGNLRPVTNIKIYGSDGGRHGGDDLDAIEKFCRNILFGASSARFHRPTSGIGLNASAQQVIQSMRMSTDAVDFFNMEPSENLDDCEENEAYLRGKAGAEYLIYFTGPGQVSVTEEGEWSIRWLNIMHHTWNSPQDLIAQAGKISVNTPSEGSWIAVLQKK